MSAIPPDRPMGPPHAVLHSFRVGSWQIPRAQQPVIQRLARTLAATAARFPAARVNVHVVGHTDSTGPERYNLRLGLQRALAVKAVLERLVPASTATRVRFWARSAGESAPVSSTASSRDRARNRRVEVFVVVDEPAQVSGTRPRRDRGTSAQGPRAVPAPRLPVPVPRPCADLAGMQRRFGRLVTMLREVYSATEVTWPGPGQPLRLRPTYGRPDPADRHRGRNVLVDSGVLRSLADEVGDAILPRGAGGVVGLGADLLLLAHSERRDQANARFHTLPSGERNRVKRQLVARRVGERVFPHARNHVALAQRIVGVWDRHDRLAAECESARGPVRPYSTIGPGPR